MGIQIPHIHKNMSYTSYNYGQLDFDLYDSPYLKTPKHQRKTGARTNALYVNLKGFDPQNIDITMAKTGGVRIVAKRLEIEDTKRTGHCDGRRSTVMQVTEELTLPEYLVKNGLLKKVKTRFDNGQLVFTYPAKPSFVTIPIKMQDEEEDEADADEEHKSIDLEILE